MRRTADTPARVVVLGAGVSGLSCALLLAEAGHAVTLWSRAEPLATTSAVAAAIWYPFEAGPPERVAGWASRSYRRFAELAEAGVPGVVPITVHDLHSPLHPRPAWVTAMDGFRELPPADCHGHQEGWAARVAVIETPLYLAWLAERVRARGVHVELRDVRDLEETRGFDAVVNCTGLGARELVGDKRCFAIKGQIVRVPRGAVTRALYFQKEGGAFGYIVPRSEDCVLGGTAERGVETLTSDAETTRAILARCRAFEPRLAQEPLSVGVGLRPGRDEIRVERERLADGRWIVHDYGHGGCGVTLSWPCAEDARALVLEALA
ncbi:MAG: FAD-dependent oxidoreductase [Planctomycetota bacterium]